METPLRRDFLKTIGAPAALAPFAAESRNTYDVAVIGAGVFGSWTAHHLQKAGKRVILIDGYGAANAQASSGGESRIIRMGYGGRGVCERVFQATPEAWL